MEDRRGFLKIMAGLAFGLFLKGLPLFAGLRSAIAGARRVILPKGTTRESLTNKNPAELDTRNLSITPLREFETMGTTDYRVSLDSWRLEISGDVKIPQYLTYEEILELPFIERDVLLICPGVFVNHGRWKGISIRELLGRAGAGGGITRVNVHGAKGKLEKSETFIMKDINSDRVFLAYEVNGERLPVIHGFPLRAVAEGHYGFEWVKYVFKVVAETCCEKDDKS